MNGNENPAPMSSNVPQAERSSEEGQWVWEPLVIDPPDICKSRLRKMVKQNAFLRGNYLILYEGLLAQKILSSATAT